jgi:hypothetical protein
MMSRHYLDERRCARPPQSACFRTPSLKFRRTTVPSKTLAMEAGPHDFKLGSSSGDKPQQHSGRYHGAAIGRFIPVGVVHRRGNIFLFDS